MRLKTIYFSRNISAWKGFWVKFCIHWCLWRILFGVYGYVFYWLFPLLSFLFSFCVSLGPASLPFFPLIFIQLLNLSLFSKTVGDHFLLSCCVTLTGSQTSTSRFSLSRFNASTACLYQTSGWTVPKNVSIFLKVFQVLCRLHAL